MKQLDREKIDLQGQLKDLEWRLDNESQVSHTLSTCLNKLSPAGLLLTEEVLTYSFPCYLVCRSVCETNTWLSLLSVRTQSDVPWQVVWSCNEFSISKFWRKNFRVDLKTNKPDSGIRYERLTTTNFFRRRNSFLVPLVPRKKKQRLKR